MSFNGLYYIGYMIMVIRQSYEISLEKSNENGEMMRVALMVKDL